MRIRSSVPLLGCLMATVGCGAGWRLASTTQPATLPPRQQVQVWMHDSQVLRLREVRWNSDSLFGLPYLAGLDRDTATVMVVSLSRIDSVRTGNPSAGLWKTVGLVVGGTVVLVLGICAVGQSCQLGD